jgi:CheY-like chemotaxis protein
MKLPIVLCADDNSDDALLFKTACRRAESSFRLVFATDGQKVIDYLNGIGEFSDREKNPVPDLLLLDLKMPRKTGIEVLGWLRNQSENATLPVAIFTSSQDKRDIQTSYENNVNWYLMKPIDFEHLVQTAKGVDQWLASGRVSAITSLPNFRA